jgi:hypothetical protein
VYQRKTDRGKRKLLTRAAVEAVASVKAAALESDNGKVSRLPVVSDEADWRGEEIGILD